MTRTIRVTQLFCRLDPSAGGLLAYLDAQTSALRASAVELRTSAVTDNAAVATHSPLGAWRLSRWLSNLIDQTDVVHIHAIFGWHALIGARACIRAGKPYVLSTHGGVYQNALATKSFRKHFFLALVGREILQGAHSVLVTSEAESEEIRLLNPHLPTELIVPGIAVPEQPLADFHSQSTSGLRMMYLGRLHPHKEVETALKATALLRASGMDASMILLGGGEAPYVNALRSLANQLGLASFVRFSGHVSGSEKVAQMLKADLMVLPSRSENFSFAVAEAMSLGIPALVSTKVGLATAICRSRCGGAFDPGDVEALAAMARNYIDLAPRREAGARAHSYAAKNLSLSRMRDGLLGVYEAASSSHRLNRQVT